MDQSYADDVPKKKSTDKTPMLDKFGKDLTKLASQNKLDPVIGRSKETKRCCQILSRKKKNNPILIGDPGVGKTNIAHGIASMIVSQACPINLYNKRVIAIEMSHLVAGTIYRGQFEERLNDLITEIKAAGNIIVFIDEIHSIVGAGNGSGSLDASNIIKPSLADGTLQIIGATTLNEFRENFENDGALTRRFQSVLVEPTTVEETIEILNRIKGEYEKHHNVNYSNDAVEACVKLSDRYIMERVLPDKAIDLMDEVGSASNTKKEVAESEKIKELQYNYNELENQKKEALKSENQNYEEAAELRNKQTDIKNQIAEENELLKTAAKNNKTPITKDMIADIVSQMTGIPVHQAEEKDLDNLSKLEEKIGSVVIGQSEAIKKIVKAIKRARVGIKRPNKPISFLLIGKTGVGKTLLAKKIAAEMFGTEDSMIRLDMSEYKESYSLSKLIGAAPGYIGYEKGGKLTEAVRRKPYSVILLDEVDKAHPDIFDPLLQVLDDGHLTDSLGRRVDFKNTIIFMTSNIGASSIQKFGTGIGFATAAKERSTKDVEDSILHKELNKFFKPEFLNRIDDILSFNPLDKENMAKILKLELSNLSLRLKDIGYIVTFDDSINDYLIEKGFDEKMGARPLTRAIQTYIEDIITDEIIDKRIVDGSSFTIQLEKDELTVKINKISSSKTIKQPKIIK